LKAWLGRAAANTVLRGEQLSNRLARWSRWYPVTPVVDESRFQAPGEPYVGHWREFPEAWTPEDLAHPNLGGTVVSAIDDLPRPWRDLIIARDVLELSALEITERDGITPDQQRAILNRARARLREHLARYFSRRGHG
jgi:RNA polymerase sigma-70 factor (ECF subfamily)